MENAAELNQVLIYDITNPDSVIAAAIYSSTTGIRPVSVTSQPDLTSVDHVVFMGVQPTPFPGTAVEFKFTFDPAIKNSKLTQVSLPENDTDDSVLGHPKSITYLVCNYLSNGNSHIQDMQGPAWVVGTALESFIACELNGGHDFVDVALESKLETVFRSRRDKEVIRTMVPVTDVPVVVYNNYYEALEYVENFDKMKDMHFLISPMSGKNEKDAYLSFMAKLKQRINRAWYAQQVSIDGLSVAMPILHLEMDVIPFAMRFIAFAHDRVILIGPDRAASRCHVFTRKGDYMAIRKLIESQSNSFTVVQW